MDCFTVLKILSVAIIVICAICTLVELKLNNELSLLSMIWSWGALGGLNMLCMFNNAGDGDVVMTVLFGVLFIICMAIATKNYWTHYVKSEKDN